MKYIKQREQFLKLKNAEEIVSDNLNEYVFSSAFINEAFESDITWGGSLLGRLINSTLRKAKIKLNRMKIKSLVSAVKTELDGLLGNYLNETEKKKKLFIEIKTLFKDMVDAVDRGEPIVYYVGDDTDAYPGIIKEIILSIDKVEDFPDGNELKQKLQAFRKDLMGLVDQENIDLNEEVAEDDDDLEETEKDEKIEETGDKLLKTSLTKLLGGKNTIKLPAGGVDGPFEKILKGDYSFLKDGNINQDQILSNFRDMLLDKGFQTYLQKKNKKLYDEIVKLTGNKKEISSDVNTNDNGNNDNADNTNQQNTQQNVQQPTNQQTNQEQRPAHRPVVHGSRMDDSFLYTEGVNQDGIKAFIDHSGKAVSAALNDWFGSISGNIALENRGRLKNTLLKSITLPNNSKTTMNFKVEKGDTLEKLAYGLALITKQDVIDYKKAHPTVKNDEMYASILRDKISKNGEDFTIDDKYKERFEGLIHGIVNMNNIDVNKKPTVDTNKPVHNKEKVTESTINERIDIEGVSNDDVHEDDAQNKLYVQDEQDTEEEGDDDIQKIDSIKDKIKAIFDKHFTQEDVEKWSVRKDEFDKLDKELQSVPIDINTKNDKDPIVRICNLFGDAYNLYTTEYIPSGRPGGKVSNRTLRDYLFIGEGSKPHSGDSPGYGPWAAKGTLNQWRKGIMKILEDTELRKILANQNLTINGNKGAGKSLMEFINEMMNNYKGDYNKTRYDLISKYFNLTEVKLYNVKGSTYGKKVSDEDMGDGKYVSWQTVSNISLTEFKNGGKFDRSFVRINCLHDRKGEKKKSSIFLFIIKYNQENNCIMCKMQISNDELPKLYLRSFGVEIQNLQNLAGKNKEVYMAAIPMNKLNALRNGVTITIPYIDCAKNTDSPKDEDVETFKIGEITQISVLSVVDKGTKTMKPFILTGVAASRPNGDRAINKVKTYANVLSKKFVK